MIPKSAACGALPDAVNLLAGSLLYLKVCACEPLDITRHVERQEALDAIS